MLLKNDHIWNWLILIADCTVMKMSDFWRNSKAIALVFCSEMTKFEIDWFWLQNEKWWKWAIFGEKVRLYLGILLKNDQNWNRLILIADWKVMKMSDIWRKSKAIALVFCSDMTKFEIDWFWLQIEKWWKWAIFGDKVRQKPWYFAKKWPNLKLIDFDSRLTSDENERYLAKN